MTFVLIAGATTEVKMKYKTTPYILEKCGVYYAFQSEKAACEFLGVPQCCVASAARQKIVYHGYTIIKAKSEFDIYADKRLHKIWESMHERCEREKHPHYKSYGGRGIKVCEEWNEYIPFAKWAFQNGYNSSLTIDRIDNEKGYFSDNCRWVTMQTQANNKRNNHIVTVNGEKMTIADCARKYGIPKSTIRYRANRGKNILEKGWHKADMREVDE